MNRFSKSWLLWLAVVFYWRAEAQTVIYDPNSIVVGTIAGSGFYGYLDGQGTQTMFNNPSKVVADSSGNLFVSDSGNSRIRKITPEGTVSTFAGGGGSSLPGYGANVSLGGYGFGSMTIDHSNVLWMTTGSGYLLRIGGDAYVSRIVLSGVSSLSGVCVDSGNNIYYSTSGGNQIYRWRTNGVLEVFAGSGNPGSIDGNGVFTSFNNPAMLAADAADNIYVWDSGNHLIRRIDQSENVTTIAGEAGSYYNSPDGVGTNTGFYQVNAMCADNSGNIILACNSSIRKITATTNVLTMAGTYIQTGYTNDVAGNLARFNGASGVCVSQGMIFVADYSNQRIRNITFNPAPQPVSGGYLDLETVAGLRITGVVGRTYQIQSSTNFSTWNPEATILLTDSPHWWIDFNALGQKKFYRAFLLP